MKKNKNMQRTNRRKNVSIGAHKATQTIFKMKIKKGDTVMVVSGKDKGKTGAVLTVLPRENRVVVDGAGMIKRHMKKTGRGQSGRIIERPSTLHASNVMVMDPSAKKPTRIGRSVEGKKKVRVTKKSKTTLK
jgi:large subunit ribosomal protein L24